MPIAFDIIYSGAARVSSFGSGFLFFQWLLDADFHGSEESES
jgi:hypothetical protein